MLHNYSQGTQTVPPQVFTPQGWSPANKNLEEPAGNYKASYKQLLLHLSPTSCPLVCVAAVLE
jgi:hypothetical protein